MFSPRDVGLPHDTWRPSQLDAYNKIKLKHSRDGGFVIVEACTGVGKSAIPTALSCNDRVLVLVQTLGLLNQYHNEYGFDIVKGRQEYNCVLDDKVSKWAVKHNRIPTSADCHFDKMSDCPMSSSCPYLEAKTIAGQSNRVACTYKYAVLSDTMRNRQGIIVLDEAHEAANEILSIAEFKVNFDSMKKFNLPVIPFLKAHSHKLLDQFGKDTLVQWCIKALSIKNEFDFIDVFDATLSEKARLKNTLKDMLECMLLDERVYFEYNDTIVVSPYTGHKTPAHIVIKPLEAKTVARRLWNNKKTIVLMSATIGNPKPLATELGISSYDFLTYKHPVPKEARPVYDLGMEKMTKVMLDTNPGLSKMQVRIIYSFIQRLNPKWRGIILTSSYKKINFLRDALYKLMPDRIVIPDINSQLSVKDRIQSFIDDPREGLIAVDTIQGWGTGLDLRGDIARFSIVAGVPFDNPTDPYNRFRMEIPGKQQYSMWNSYNSIPQTCGRVSRGEKNTRGEYMLNVGAIADGSALSPTAMRYLPSWFKESIV